MRRISARLQQRIDEAEAAVAELWRNQVIDALADAMNAASALVKGAIKLRLQQLSQLPSRDPAWCAGDKDYVVIILRAVQDAAPDVARSVAGKFGIDLGKRRNVGTLSEQ